jgi:hypothetical protein
MCIDRRINYACGHPYSVETPYLTCEYAEFNNNLREFVPEAESSTLYKDSEKHCQEGHRVWHSRFKMNCPDCGPDETGERVVENGKADFEDAGMSLPGSSAA